MRTNLFPLVVIERAQPSQPRSVRHDENTRTRHEIPTDRKVTLRTDSGRVDLWVTAGPGDETDGSPQDVEFHLRYARLVSLTESEVVYEGVEQMDFHLTNRAARVILTNHEAGY